MIRSRHTCLLLFAIVAVLLVADTAWACPGCKQALFTAEGEQANMVNGYFWSILFMLAMPFTCIGLFSASMYRAVKKAKRLQEQTEHRQVEVVQ